MRSCHLQQQTDLQRIMLSQISQLEKDKYQMISLICGIQINKTNEQIKKTRFLNTENKLVVGRGEVSGGGGGDG